MFSAHCYPVNYFVANLVRYSNPQNSRINKITKLKSSSESESKIINKKSFKIKIAKFISAELFVELIYLAKFRNSLPNTSEFRSKRSHSY